MLPIKICIKVLGHQSPIVVKGLKAIGSQKMYKMQYKPDNQSLHITISYRNYNSWTKNGKKQPIFAYVDLRNPLKMGHYWPQNRRKCIKCNTNQIIHHFISLFLKEIIIHGQKWQKQPIFTYFDLRNPLKMGHYWPSNHRKCIKCRPPTSRRNGRETSGYNSQLISADDKAPTG